MVYFDRLQEKILKFTVKIAPAEIGRKSLARRRVEFYDIIQRKLGEKKYFSGNISCCC